jgi:CRP-like cAMP-binding protein
MTNFPQMRVTASEVRNGILSGLASNVLAELVFYMERVKLERHQILYQPGETMRRVHFIQSGMVIFTKMMRDGRGTMIGFSGVEGMTIPNVLNGLVRTDVECAVHVAGMSLAIDSVVLQRVASRIPDLSAALKRYALFMDEQVAQISGCNRLHALEQRCARLLLSIHDNVNAAAFALTQESIAAILGAQRPHVSAVAAHFQELKLIQYKHGQICVTDYSGLKSLSCECYEFIGEQMKTMLHPAVRNVP